MPHDLGVMLFHSVSIAIVQMEAGVRLSERLKRRRDSIDSEDNDRDEKRVEADLGQLHGLSSTDSSSPSQSMKQVLADNEFFSKLKTEYRIGFTADGSSASSYGSAGGSSSSPSALDTVTSSCSSPFSKVTSHPTDFTGYPVGQGILAMSPLECGLEDLVSQPTV